MWPQSKFRILQTLCINLSSKRHLLQPVTVWRTHLSMPRGESVPEPLGRVVAQAAVPPAEAEVGEQGEGEDLDRILCLLPAVQGEGDDLDDRILCLLPILELETKAC